MPLVISTCFRTEERSEMNGLINEFKVDRDYTAHQDLKFLSAVNIESVHLTKIYLMSYFIISE